MVKTRTNHRWLVLCFVLTYALVFFFTFFPYANDGPRGIHQWAQADRVAVCLRYIEGKALLDPATYSMKTPDGNTGVEFSGYQFILAKIVQAGFPIKYLSLLFRLVTFTLFFTSLFALVFSLLKKEKMLFNSLVTIFLLSSPILLYYGYNFLPDVLALSMILVCFYLMHRNLDRYILLILCISGLSMLIKTSSGIYFISFMAIYFLQNVKKWDTKLSLAGVLFVLIAAGVAYYDYFLVHVRSKDLWSVVFLSEPMRITSWEHFTFVLDTASRYTYDYFSRPQWWLILALGVLSIWVKRKEILTNINWRLALLVALGLSSLTLLFGIQFMNHDYYVIGTFIPIIIYFTLKAIAYFAPYVHPRTAIVIMSIFALTSFSKGNARYFERMSEIVHIDGYAEPYERNWILGAAEVIDRYVPADDLIFTVYNMEPNWSLVYAGRRGATFTAEELARDNSPFDYYLRLLKPNYVLCRTSLCDQFAIDNPDFIAKAIILHQDKNITLYHYGH
jgi:hypothetical protein